ncbi:hypothetical protein Tco_1025401 [Tanacetum coccineum]
MKSRITLNPRRQPPEQSREGGMEVNTPESRHQLLVSYEDSDETDLLHLGPGRGRRVVYSTGWEEKNKVHLHVLTAATRVPTQREPRCNKRSIITGAHRPVEPADIWRVKTAMEVTGNPNQRGIDLRAAFRENYLQQTKHIKDPVEIHHIKQKDGESTEDFMERYKAEVLDVEGASECMKISGFMHGITHPELIKRLYEKIPRSIDEMYRVTTPFLQGEVTALSHSKKKAPAPWR